MYNINIANVTALFKKLCNLDDTQTANSSEIILAAISYVEEKIILDEITDSQGTRLEYAAACVASYDYTIYKLMNDTTLCTYDGKSTTNYKDTSTYQYALYMRNNALGALHGICEQDGFVFSLTGGD